MTTKPRKPERKAASGAVKRKRGGKATKPGRSTPASTKPAGARRSRDNSKQAQLIGMLKRPDGITIEEAAKAFGWQLHTVRGAIYGALKKKLGLKIDSEKVEGRGRVFRIAD
jgi:hypothetical protein